MHVYVSPTAEHTRPDVPRHVDIRITVLYRTHCMDSPPWQPHSLMSATDRLPTDPASSLPVVAASYQRRATTPLVATPVSPLDLAQLAPRRPLLHLDEERHAQLRRLLHAVVRLELRLGSGLRLGFALGLGFGLESGLGLGRGLSTCMPRRMSARSRGACASVTSKMSSSCT